MAVERLASAKARLLVVLHLIEYGWRPRRIIGIDTLRKAERSVKDGLAEIERQLGPHSIELVPFLNTLGGIQWRIGVMDANERPKTRLANGDAFYERAIGIMASSYRQDDPLVAFLYNNMAVLSAVFKKKGRFVSCMRKLLPLIAAIPNSLCYDGYWLLHNLEIFSWYTRSILPQASSETTTTQFTEIRRALGKRVQEIEIFDEPGAPWARLKRLLASSLTFDEILEEESKSIDRILSEAEEASWKLVIREEQETEPARDGRLACVERCEKTIGVLLLGLFTIPFLIGGGWSFLFLFLMIGVAFAVKSILRGRAEALRLPVESFQWSRVWLSRSLAEG
jgi:hypothetical protein